MECKVEFSNSTKILTVAVILLFVGIIIFAKLDGEDLWILYLILIIMLASGLYYSPLSVRFKENNFMIHRFLKDKVIPLDSIAFVDYCFPSPGGLRLCGSGGFMGYWGYFHDIAIGTFFGYYGKREQCVMLRLKSGRQYVVSCSDPAFIVSGINGYLKKDKQEES